MEGKKEICVDNPRKLDMPKIIQKNVIVERPHRNLCHCHRFLEGPIDQAFEGKSLSLAGAFGDMPDGIYETEKCNLLKLDIPTVGPKHTAPGKLIKNYARTNFKTQHFHFKTPFDIYNAFLQQRSL